MLRPFSTQSRKAAEPRRNLIFFFRFASLCLCVFALNFLFLLSAAADPPAAQPVFHSSLQSASDAAAADQSLVLLIFGAEWCGPCKLLEKKTLAAPEFLRQESPLHVAHVDIDENKKMAGDFGIEAVPTLILLTADGKIVERQTGFMEAADLLTWLKEGRARAAAGKWEGTAPGAQFGELLKKAAADNLGTNEILKLVDLLGDADPANREQAGKMLLAQRERAVPQLIEAAGNSYLGTRISASELLQRLAPNAAPVDPWQSPTETSNAVVALRKWWATTGKLPAVSSVPSPSSFSTNAAQEAIGQLRGDNPVQRTAAMTDLVRFGPDALPAVRDAIKRAEKSGDQRALGLLEDVRWTILVPDSVEQQSGGVRAALARGKSSERQAATEKLGAVGRDALGVLLELASDSDPLVVESAIRALSGVNVNDAVPALAGLLKSGDSNLRMTAAQALGHTKKSAAINPLLAAIHDPDEVVACTALSALEEIQSPESPYNRTQRPVPPEIAAGLKRCMSDPRWRVRASAAEVAGKLNATPLTDDLKRLLNDPDGFVVKSAMTALGKTGSAPKADELMALSRRLPSLQGDAMEMMMQVETDETVKTVTKLFAAGNTETRLAILNAFLRRGAYDNPATDEGWKPMFAQAVASPDARLRRTAAEVLNRRSPKLAVGVVGSLLADSDPATRRLAAELVLRILNEGNGGASTTRTYFSSSARPQNVQPLATPAQQARWHASMLQLPEPSADLSLAAAIFATGDGESDLPTLLAALEKSGGGAEPGRLNSESVALAIGTITPLLVLPADRAVLEKFSASPVWFALAVRQSARCQPRVSEFLLDSARFRAALEPATGNTLSECLGLLAGYDYAYEETKKWSLWKESTRTKMLAEALLSSTNAAWRAVAVFSLGLRADGWVDLPVFEKATADANSWVRASAVKAIARNVKDRTKLESKIAPLLAETNLSLAGTVAVALLEPETRLEAGLDSRVNFFQFENFYGGRTQNINTSDVRPLAVLTNQPPFLAAAREWLARTSGKASAPFALLLAQFGDFSGVDRLAKQAAALDADTDERSADVLLAGIELSQDDKFVPVLQQLAAVRHEDYELRKILSALKGMTGPDARQLRLDINKKLRNTSGASGGVMY